MDIADLRVVVGADVSGAEKGLDSLGSRVESFGSSFAKVFTTAALAGTAALVAGLGASVTAASGFEKRMSGVGAVSGATAAQMKELGALALKLGADTSFSASEAAEGIEELVKAGVSLGDVMGGGAKASLDLAAAGAISVADAATIAANAMNQFHLKGSDMAHIADLIAGAANASAIDVGQFKFSLAAAGAVAATVGFSFDDLAQAIAVMGQAGIVGSDAGTSLKTMMMNLQPQTKAQITLFKQLGLTTKNGANAFFDATGKVKSMAQVAQILQTALKGQTQQQKLATLETLFGSDAIRAAAVLAEAGAEGFTDMADAMGKVSAADVAEKRLDNLSGSIEKLTGSLSTVAITIGLGLTPHLKKLADWATEILNAWLPTISAFADKIPGAIDAAAEAFGNFIDVLQGGIDAKPLLHILDRFFPDSVSDGIVDGISQIGGAWRAFIGTLNGQPVPDMWSTSGKLAVGFALILRDQVGGALSWLSTTGLPLLAGALGIVGAYVTGVFIPLLTAAWTWLAPNLQAALGFLATVGFPSMLLAVQAVGIWLESTYIPTLTAVWDWMANKIGAALTWLTTTAWPALGNAANAVQNWFSDTLMPTLSTLWEWLSPKLNDAFNWLIKAGWPKLQEAASTFWSWATGPLFTALSEWYDWFQLRLSPVYQWFISYGWPKLQAAGEAVGSWLSGTLFPSLSEWYEWLQDRLSPVHSWFITYAWPQLQAAGESVTSWLTGTLFPSLSEWWDWLQARLSPAYSWFIDYAWPTLLSAGSDFSSWLTGSFFPTIREWWVWMQERLAPNFKWYIEYGWPKLYEGALAYYDLLAGRLIKSLQGLNAELARTDNAESWVTIFENLGKFGKYLIENIDLGGWFRKVGGGAGEAGQQVGYVAQAIAWISRTLAKWSSFLPGASKPPEIDDAPKAPGSSGGGGGGGGNVQVPDLPGRSTGGGGGGGGGGSPPPGGGSPSPAPAPPPPPIFTPAPPAPPPTFPTPSPGGPSPTGPIDNSSRAAFVKSSSPFMLQAAGGNKDLAAMMLAAAISENGDVGKGGSFIGNNFFGIKGEGPAGSFLADTWEMINGKKVYIKDKFAAYHDPVEGFGGFMDFLQKNSRYRTALAAFGQTGNAVQLFYDIVTAGYATDKTWADKIVNIRKNQVSPITGYARGGWAGLNGPELAMLGERGPEYIVPHHALRGQDTGRGSLQTLRLDVAIGGKIAKQVVIEGYEIAYRHGWRPGGATR